MIAAYLRKTPFVKIVLPFIAGIILQLFFPQSPVVCHILIIVSVISLTVISLSRIFENFNYSYLWGLSLTFLFFCSGIFLTFLKLRQNEVPEIIYNSSAQIIEITDIPAIGEKSIKTTAQIKAYQINKKWQSCDCSANIYFKKDDISKVPEPGDLFLFFSKVKKIDLPVSPYQFNYSKYFYYKGIQCQMVVNSNKTVQLRTIHKSIQSTILKLRQSLLEKLHNDIVDKHGRAVLSSLVLGFTGDLDNELRTSYAIAGTVHILSVSGLHVGIVYYLLLYLFFFMNKSQTSRIVRSILIIIGVWFYAIITGFAPPVIRSAVMFSFFAAGEAINRGGNGLNTLAASAFFILICNPLQITDIGFQLSYTAIIGIMFFYGPIYKLHEFKHRISDKIWALVAVSLAAQIGTLPISLLYFHQFPLYFILSNMVIVPLSTVVLYGGLLLILVSPWHFAATLLGYVMKYLLIFMNGFIFQIEQLPYACIKNLYLSLIESVLLALVIFSIALWIKEKRWQYIYLFLFSFFAFTVSKSVREINSEKQQYLVTHNLPGHCALSIINEKSVLLISDSSSIVKIDKASTDLYLAKNIIKKKNIEITTKDTVIEKISIHHFAGNNLLVEINDKKIVVLNDRNINEYILKSPIDIDYLVISKPSIIRQGAISNFFKPSEIIYTTGLKDVFSRNVKELEKPNISTHFVAEEGAYEAEL